MNENLNLLPGSFQALVDYIVQRYRSAVEIGIGAYPEVALVLKTRGVRVRATDIRWLSEGRLPVVRDDVTRPSLSVYQGADLLYSLRPPLELVGYMQKLAARLPADLIVKPLASEAPPGRPVRLEKGFFYYWNYAHGGRRP
ncbi:MAG: hypothetical protein HY892_07285 [Deltaproteobacteria bacterium]|nr:hypothetical protein [Deltaproteobacteria bacterium]